MLWIISYIIGLAVGGAVMYLALREKDKFNMRLLEIYWRTDINYLKNEISALKTKKI